MPATDEREITPTDRSQAEMRRQDMEERVKEIEGREALAAFEEWWRRHCQAAQVEPDNRATCIARVAFLAAWNSQIEECAKAIRALLTPGAR